MPEENRNIELDLDQDQPVKTKKVEGAWGLYEEAVDAKEAAGQDSPAAAGSTSQMTRSARMWLAGTSGR